MRLLHIDSSITGDDSVSRELSALIVKRLADGVEATVSRRDLAREDFPHVKLGTLPSAHPLAGSAEPLDAPARAGRQASDAALEEFLSADVVVIGAPMYNFTIPSTLKAWIDRIVVSGKTYRYGAGGSEGLVPDKRVIVALARGNFYGPETAAASTEHVESYLRVVFGFLGITNLQFVLAEGVRRSEQNKENALVAARFAVQQLTS